ncbi:MAG: LuxR C-terminal-related transcriptional regulator [Chloroflexota bacterium]|nr:LuxR C-terminal-related transcriptional regulator [Chloroflexota bacterium]
MRPSSFAEAVAAPVLDVSDPPLAFAHLDAEQDNLRAALAWAADRREEMLLLQLVVGLRWYWHMRGYLTEGRAWADHAVAVCDGASPALRATAGWEAGWFARVLDDHLRAEALAAESLGLSRSIGDGLMTAKALYLLAFVAEDRGEPERALTLHQEALQLLLPTNQPYWTAHAMYHAGQLSSVCGDLTTAERLLNESLARCREEGHSYGPALVLSGLAEVALKRGDHAGAAALWQERLGLTWDVWGLRWCLEGLGAIAIASGQNERAARLLGAAEAERERLGVVPVPGQLRVSATNVEAVRGALGETAFAAAWEAGRQMSRETARAEAAQMAQALPLASPDLAWGTGLTPRELDVLALLVEGRSNREIAETLFVSPRTVDNHVTNILAKLEVKSRTAAVAAARRLGLA